MHLHTTGTHYAVEGDRLECIPARCVHVHNIPPYMIRGQTKEGGSDGDGCSVNSCRVCEWMQSEWIQCQWMGCEWMGCEWMDALR